MLSYLKAPAENFSLPNPYAKINVSTAKASFFLCVCVYVKDYTKLRIDATSASNCGVNIYLHRSRSLFFLVCSITFQHSLCIDLLNDLLISGSHKSSLKILQSKSYFYGAVCIPAQDVLLCPLGPTYHRITQHHLSILDKNMK